MLQIILQLMSIFCKIGGKWFFMFIQPLISPFSWSTLTLSVFLPIFYAKKNFMNYDEETGKKDSTKAFGYAFLIHYVICVILLFFLYTGACKVSDAINPYASENAMGLVSNIIKK